MYSRRSRRGIGRCRSARDRNTFDATALIRCLIHVPAAAHLTAPAPPQVLGQGGGELSLPLPDGFIAEHNAAHGEHLGQVTQAQLVAQAPEHHEGDDIGRVLRAVQHTAAALVELLAACAAAEPAIALGGVLGPLRHSLRPALYAAHSHPLRREGRLHSRASPRWPEALARALTEPLEALSSSEDNLKERRTCKLSFVSGCRFQDRKTSWSIVPRPSLFRHRSNECRLRPVSYWVSLKSRAERSSRLTLPVSPWLNAF